MPVLITSYSEANQDSSAPLNAVTAYGPAFICPGVLTLDSCKFFMKIRTGTPDGTVNAKLYAATGTPGSTGKPTGAVLATSDNVNASTLTSSYALITFAFSGAQRIALSAANYVITVWYPTGVADAKDVAVGYDASAVSGTDQNYAETGDTGVGWTAFATLDVCFYIYSADPAGASRSSVRMMTGIGM